MKKILFRNARVFDGLSPDLLENRYVLVADGVIERVGEGEVGELDQDWVDIDLQGRVLMPGLIDAHVHATCAGLDVAELTRRPASYLFSFANMFLNNALMRGFCTVRDAGGADFGLADAIEAGFLKGPRLFFSGKALGQTGGHGDFRTSPEHEICACNYNGQIALVVDGVDAVRKAAREELRKGATQIKLFVSGGVVSPSDPIWMKQMTDDEIKAAVEEAATRRTYVMAHAHTAEAIERAARLGVRSIEHGTMIDDDTAQTVAEAGAFVVPTLALIFALNEEGEALGFPKVSQDKLKEIFDYSLSALEVCWKHGIQLGFGTDLIGVLERHQCSEFQIRSQVLSPFEILTSATAVNASLLQMEGKLGVVRDGAIADLLVVDRNPLEDLSVFDEKGSGLSVIMKDGRFYKNRMINFGS